MIDRRRMLTSTCLLLAALTSQAAAQPAGKPVTIVVPYAAGGGTDTVSRLIAKHMSKALGRPVVIENQVGGGSTIANDRVARSAPDGSTVLINHVALLAAPSLFNNLRYDTEKPVRADRPRQQRADAADWPQVDFGRARRTTAWINEQGPRQTLRMAGSGPIATSAPS